MHGQKGGSFERALGHVNRLVEPDPTIVAGVINGQPEHFLHNGHRPEGDRLLKRDRLQERGGRQSRYQEDDRQYCYSGEARERRQPGEIRVMSAGAVGRSRNEGRFEDVGDRAQAAELPISMTYELSKHKVDDYRRACPCLRSPHWSQHQQSVRNPFAGQNAVELPRLDE